MSWLTQTQRFLQLDLLPQSMAQLVPLSFSGVETLSQPFTFSLQLVSDDTAIDPKYILSKPATVTINANSRGPQRYFHGYVQKFKAEQVVQGTRYYQIELQPWLSFLNFTSDCLVFQQKTVVEIVAMIFESFGFSHVFNTSGLSKTYKSREYCVQYRETALHFISRLLEEEGIYYFFKHENGKHIMMLADSPAAIKPLDEPQVTYTAGSHKDQCITRFTRNYQFYTGKTAHTDYNYKNPGNPLLAQQQGNAKLQAAQNYEHFEYPGLYQDSHFGHDRAQHRFEAQEAEFDTLQGESNYISFGSGRKFSIENAPTSSDNGDYALVSVMHYASDSSYLHDNNGNQSYHNFFTCIPATTPFRSSLNFAKPVVHGAQNALVVGGPGEELETSAYGQVKVQFHWDRKGKKNEYSSCWLRVAQLWAGKNWGAVFIPRIGQEVIVHFLEGDPDRPLIMGTVYNGDNLPPYSLPGTQTRSGIRTASTKGASADEYNELYFEDHKGGEEIYIQAQKDFNKLVKNNLSVTVKNDHSHKTQNNSNVTVGNDYSHATTNNSTVSVGNDYSQNTTNNAMQFIGNNYTHTTTNNAAVTVGNDYNQTTVNNATVSVGNNYTQNIKNVSQTIAGSSALISASESIVLQVGSTSIVISPSGVIINTASMTVNKG